uniref:Uncharacterized protein n=1 Tax=Rhizophora mucronata TaxID=61149 RepID=A0A2P2Q992_RHIMU
MSKQVWKITTKIICCIFMENWNYKTILYST